MMMKTGAYLFPSQRLLRPILHRVEHRSQRYHVDDSHNLIHAVDVARLAQQIHSGDQEGTMVCALLHDTIDKKYIPKEYQAAEEASLRQFLRWELGYSPTIVASYLHIMKSLSYHVTIQPDPEQPTKKIFVLPVVMALQAQQHGARLLDIFHAVRQADLLTSYDVERMLLYKYTRLFTDIDDVVKDTLQTYQDRVLPLSHIEGLFPSEEARTMRQELAVKSAEKIEWLKECWRQGLLQGPSDFLPFRILGEKYSAIKQLRKEVQ